MADLHLGGTPKTIVGKPGIILWVAPYGFEYEYRYHKL